MQKVSPQWWGRLADREGLGRDRMLMFWPGTVDGGCFATLKRKQASLGQAILIS